MERELQEKQDRLVLAGEVCAAVRNAQRTKDSQPYFTWKNFCADILTPIGMGAQPRNKLRESTKLRMRQLAERAQVRREGSAA